MARCCVAADSAYIGWLTLDSGIAAESDDILCFLRGS